MKKRVSTPLTIILIYENAKILLNVKIVASHTFNLLYKLCRKLTLEYPKDKYPPEKIIPHFVGRVPDDIQIDRTSGDFFILYGKYYQLYYEVLTKLRGELALEYLEDRDLKEKLWHLVCEMIANYATYRNVNVLKEKLEEFQSDLLKPIDDYEVLVPVLYLDARNSVINIGNTIVRRFDEESLERWGVPRTSPGFEHIANKTMIVVLEKGNNPELVCDRARRKAKFIIRILQSSLSTNRFIHDEETLYEIDSHVIYRKINSPTTVGLRWYRGHKPIQRDIDEALKKDIESFVSKISDVFDERRLPQELRERFIISTTWIGKAVEEEDPDLKVTYLFTALETILTTLSDRMKGETIAYRMLLLNALMNEAFVHPAKVLWIYELRSKVIHGSALAIASKSEYYTLRRVAIDTLVFALEVIHNEGLKSHAEFIETLEIHGDNNAKALKWLEEQGDERSLTIKKTMEKIKV